VPKRISSQKRLVDLVEVPQQLVRLRKKLRSGRKHFSDIKLFYDPGGIAGRHTVGRNVVYHHGAGPDDTVFTDINALADDGAVTDPHIIFDSDGCGFSDGNAVVNVMPVGIGEVGIAGNHTVVAHQDFMGRSDPYSGTDQTVVADSNATLARFFGPDRQPDPFVGGGHHVDVITQFDGCPKEFQIPGTHKHKAFAQRFQLGAQEVVNVEFLEF